MTTSKINPNKVLLSKFAGQKAFITVPKIYYQLTKCLNKAFLLNQLVFYTGQSTCLKGDWFYKSYEEWLEEIMVCERTLRSYFKEFTQAGWIDMRIQKIKGVRTPIFRANLDAITLALLALESDSLEPEDDTKSIQIEQQCSQTATIAELHNNVPKRQILPNSQTANFAVSNTIYTEEKKHKKLTNCEPPSSSLVFSKLVDESLLSQKLESDKRSDAEFLHCCVDHVDNYSDKKYPRMQRANALVKLLTKLKWQGIIFRAKEEAKTVVPSTIINPFTPDELDLASRYRSGARYNKINPGHLDAVMPNKAEQVQALQIIERMNKLNNSQTIDVINISAQQCYKRVGASM